MKSKKKGWLIALIILAVATVINIFVPDPLPVVDEVVMTAGTLFTGYKTLTS